jgi:surface polysaccharide O-acyltransferase-like enzyme
MFEWHDGLRKYTRAQAIFFLMVLWLIIMLVNRDLIFDTFRGIAIIAVVAIHAIYLGGDPDSPGFLYYRQLLNFCVPAFFFMAGYWSSKKQIGSFKEYKTFLKRKFFRVGIPYLFWSFMFLGYSAFMKPGFNGSEAAFSLLTGGACLGYYFIIAIAQLYALTPLLQYINRRLNWYGLMLIFVFNVVVISILYLSRLFHVIRPLPLALPFYAWIIYYEFGLFWGERYSGRFVSSKIRVLIPLGILVFLLVSALEVSILLSKYNDAEFASYAIKFSSLAYSAFVILGFLFWRQYFRRLPRLLSIIGRYSFGIYLIHIIFLGFFVKLFGNFSVISSFQPVYQLVLVAATIGVCFVVIGSARRFLPKFVSVKIFGF